MSTCFQNSIVSAHTFTLHFLETIDAVFLTIVFCLICCEAVQAGLVFTVAQRTPGAIALDDTAIFDVSVATDAATGNLSTFGGVTFFLTADDPGAVGGKTTGGKFTFGTNNPADPIAGGRSYLFLPGESAFANQGDSFMVFTASGANRSLGTDGGLLGSFVLNTAGATAGVHTMGFTQLHAIDANAFTLAGPFVGMPLSYVVGVPEPSSFLYTVCVVMIAIVRIRRRFSFSGRLGQ